MTTIENHIKTLHEKFERLQSSIEESDASELQKNDRVNFDNNFCNLEVLLLEKVSDLSVTNTLSDLPLKKDKARENISKCRLPEIELPKFDGKYTSWLTFRDEFENLVHKNDSVDDIDKFRYLISCLRDGEAYSVIEYLPRTTLNYSVAWNRLVDKFDNDITIKKNYIKDIYNIACVREDSVSSLQHFIDTFLKFFNALKALGVDVSNWDLFIVHHLSLKLDNKTRIDVEMKSPVDNLLTIDDFIQILVNRCRFLSAISQPSSTNSRPKTTTRFHNASQLDKSQRTMVTTSLNCAGCLQSDHIIYKCDNFLAKTPEERFDVVKKRKLCINCLSLNHVWQKCTSKTSCRECGKRHHSLLHRTSNNSNTSAVLNSNDNSTQQSQPSTSAVITTDTSNNKSELTCAPTSINHSHLSKESHTQRKSLHDQQVLIATAIVWIYDDAGFRTPCRVILDSASHGNFVTDEFCKKLNVKRRSCHTSITGIGEATTTPRQILSLNVVSRVSNFDANLDFLILPKITNKLPLRSFDFDKSQLPPNFELADPYFNQANKIDMLIGSEIYHDIVTGERVDLFEKFPPFQKTEFGYVLSGKINMVSNAEQACSFITTLDEINNNIQRFWSVESIISPSTLSIEERECEQHYADHVTRENDGRYVVALPTKSNVNELGSSKNQALSQCLRLEQRMIRNEAIREQYTKFMKEYVDLGHMELEQECESFGVEYYLPHHCILKSSSETTKFRVVFNGSFKTTHNLSLNDILKTGPTIQDDIFTILVRFRKYKYVFTADIVKMYRQVNIRDPDRNLQKIWWRDSPDKPLKTYRLRTVTYGTSSAPFLAIRTLKQLALDEQNKFPKASKILMSDFYVDDVLSGSESIEQTESLRNDLIQLVSLGGFELSKFSSNYSVTASNIETPVILHNCEDIEFSNVSSNLKAILGIKWCTNRDLFVISFGKLSSHSSITVTKRSILSEVTQIFDPLGLCSPVVFYAKCLMQRIWLNAELSWDDVLPQTIHDDWLQFRDELLKFNVVYIPRCITSINSPKLFTLHGFGDASDKGYGCCIYITSYDVDKNCESRLVCSKSRVAPMRKQTTPLLELCASLLLSIDSTDGKSRKEYEY